MSASPQSFGPLPDGTEATLYTLENGGHRVRVTDYGGRLVSIDAPDRHGVSGDILLGFDDAASYARGGGAFGAILGRTANRIANGELPIDGVTYQLMRNENGNTLHGGERGFDKLLWSVGHATTTELRLGLLSPDGDQGFPGEIHVAAQYRLESNSLILEFEASTTKATVVSLSAHPYFNLAGPSCGDILNHRVTIPADAFLPTDRRQIPTGEIRSVAGTHFDFREDAIVASRIRHADEQLLYGQGYDHYFVLCQGRAGSERLAARVEELQSGRLVEVWTTQPGVQFYTGNQLNGSISGRGGVIYRQSAGLAFEPQGFPDAPHHPNFTSTILRPGDLYRETIRYRFATA